MRVESSLNFILCNQDKPVRGMDYSAAGRGGREEGNKRRKRKEKRQKQEKP